MPATRAPSRRPPVRRWVRECDEVNVWCQGLGWVPVTKKTAAKLLKTKRGRLTARAVPELGLVLLDITT